MKHRGAVVFMLTMLLSFSGLAYSQENTEKEVVSAKDLSDKTNAEDMAEALKSIPGIYIREGQINIRDASSNKVLILIDGQRMNSAQSGEFDATSIPIDAIEKVEVLRGGNSARYGADAVGGVVNFITRRAGEKSNMDLGLRATYGSFNSQFYNVYTSNSVKHFNYYLSYKRTQTDGNFTYKETNGTEATRTNNYNKANDFLVKLGYDELLPLSKLTFSTQVTSSETGTPGSVVGLVNWPIITPNAYMRLDNMIYNLNYSQSKVFGDADFAANTYYHNFRIRYDDPDSYPAPTHSDQKSSAYGLELTQNNPVSSLMTLTYGYVYRHDHANSNSIGIKNRDTQSGHLAVNFGLKNLGFFFDNVSVVPAVRYDAPSDFDKVFSPKISVTLGNTSEYAFGIDANLSKSYRAPTFNDLYWPEDAYTAGNPNLKPEKGTTFELGYGVTIPFLSKTLVKMNYFYSKLTDQIIWAPRADYKWVPTNVSQSLTTGLETYVGVKLMNDMLNLEINHTYMDARDKSGGSSDGKLLIYRPYHKLDLNGSLTMGLVNVNLNYQFLSKRYVDVGNTAALSDVSLWNANVGVTPAYLGLKWSARFDLNNILNKNYRLSDGYPMPGREVRFTVGISLL